jgi:cellulose synthase/poly-beta-1,6-N-acetylglucosamine synthase-like glycosyltransferase
MTFIRFLMISEYVILIYFLIISVVYLLLSILAYFKIRNYLINSKADNFEENYYTGLYKPVSILIPAYNEEVSIVDSAKSVLSLNYPEFEVIVINDGSTDKTFEVLKNHFEMVELVLDKGYKESKPEIESIWTSKTDKIMVVNKLNGGKASALNIGVHVSRYPLVCNIDSDSILDRNALMIIAKPFTKDSRVIAAGGIIRVANSCEVEHSQIRKVRFPKSILAGFQVIEYLRAFLMGRLGWDTFNGLFIISGAFGLFSKPALKNIGGYSNDSVGEDMELVVKLHRYYREMKLDYRITFVPDPVCWTEVPENIFFLARQRNRWQRGMMDTLKRHRKMLFNPKYGALGFFVYPYFLFFELLGPVIEFLGYVLVGYYVLSGTLNTPFFIAYFIMAFLLGSFISLFSILLEEISFRKYRDVWDLIKLFVFSFLETFFFRPLTVIWRVQGILSFIAGNKKWGKMKRKGMHKGHS